MGCGASRRQHSANAIAPCKDDPEKGLIPRRDSLLHEWVQTMQTDIFTGLLNACDDAIYNDSSCQPFPQLKEADIDGVIQRFVPSLRAILLRPHAKIVEVSRISSSSTGTTGCSQSQTPSRSSRTEGNGGMHQSSVADSSSNHGLGRTLSDQQECHTGEKGGVKIQVEATRAPSSVASASDETLTRSLSHPQGGAALDAGFAKAPSSVALRVPPSRSNTGIDEAAVAASEAFHRTPSNASRQWGRTLSMDDFPQSSSDDNCGRLSSSVSGTFMIHRLASEEVNAVDIAASAPNSDFLRAPSAPVSIQGFLETKTAAAFTMSLPATDFARTWSIEKQRISTVKEEGSESDLEEDSFEEDVAQAPEHNFQSVKVALQSMGGGMGEALKSMPFKSSSRPAKLPDPKSYAKATCLFFDIVEFSKICAERSSEHVGQWLLKIHEVVEVNMRQHAVQIVEIRGDCYICITGTQHVTSLLPHLPLSHFVLDLLLAKRGFFRGRGSVWVCGFMHVCVGFGCVLLGLGSG